MEMVNDYDLENNSGLIINSLIRRMLSHGGFGLSADGKRDYNALFGYGETLNYNDFFDMYSRGGIAHAVVTKLPRACWRDPPELRVGQEQVLSKELHKLKTIGVFRALERADILQRIGSFAVLLVGIPDGLRLEEPMGTASNLNEVYFKPYGYDAIEILERDADPFSPRYGLPVRYNLSVQVKGEKEFQTLSRIAHWTRIIHLAEGSLDSQIEGESCLQPIWNALIDKEKVRGSAAEAYFRNARQKFALTADKDAKGQLVGTALDDLKSEVLNFSNGYTDFMRLSGMKADVMQPGLVSPKDAFMIAIQEISGVTGIPIRILIGEGGGQLAGSEDRASWNSLVVDRQEAVCGEFFMALLKLLDRAGLISIPDGMDIAWPVRASLNTLEMAESQFRQAQAFNHLTTGLTSPVGVMFDAQSILKELRFDKIELTGTPRPATIIPGQTAQATAQTPAKDTTSDES